MNTMIVLNAQSFLAAQVNRRCEVALKLDNVRERSWSALCLIVLIYFATIIFFSATFGGLLGRTLYGWQKATGGFVAPHLVLPLATFALILPVVFRPIRTGMANVGWRGSAAVSGVLVTFGFWLSMQMAYSINILCRGNQPAWESSWYGYPEMTVASLTVQLLGIALLEETVFRGFLLPQLYLKASRSLQRNVALGAASAISLGLFILSHVPNWVISADIGVPELRDHLLWLIPFGTALTLVFLVTRNLFVAVGLHALWNAPLALVPVSRPDMARIWFTLVVALSLGWLAWRIQRKPRSTAATTARDPFPHAPSP
jgi:membrane protease YdiL (CAAX protease family)